MTLTEMPVGRQLGLLISDVARLFRKRFEQVARTHQLGLTRAQAAVLIHLSRQEGIRQVTLAQLMELEPITLVRLLDKLEAAGLVERRPDPLDRRAHVLFLHQNAPPVLARIQTLVEEVREESMASLDRDECEILFDTLWTMKTNLLAQLSAHAETRAAAELASADELKVAHV